MKLDVYFELFPSEWQKLNQIIEEAKAMEREQIVEAFVECWQANMPDGYGCKLGAVEYYNETYGGDK